MTGVVKQSSYTYTGEVTGARGDAEVAESTNGSIRIELTVDGQLYGAVTLHHTMWAQIVRDFPGPAPLRERIERTIAHLDQPNMLTFMSRGDAIALLSNLLNDEMWSKDG